MSFGAGGHASYPLRSGGAGVGAGAGHLSPTLMLHWCALVEMAGAFTGFWGGLLFVSSGVWCALCQCYGWLGGWPGWMVHWISAQAQQEPPDPQ